MSNVNVIRVHANMPPALTSLQQERKAAMQTAHAAAHRHQEQAHRKAGKDVQENGEQTTKLEERDVGTETDLDDEALEDAFNTMQNANNDEHAAAKLQLANRAAKNGAKNKQRRDVALNMIESFHKQATAAVEEYVSLTTENETEDRVITNMHIKEQINTFYVSTFNTPTWCKYLLARATANNVENLAVRMTIQAHEIANISNSMEILKKGAEAWKDDAIDMREALLVVAAADLRKTCLAIEADEEATKKREQLAYEVKIQNINSQRNHIIAGIARDEAFFSQRNFYEDLDEPVSRSVAGARMPPIKCQHRHDCPHRYD
jgi:hypothetical protein